MFRGTYDFESKPFDWGAGYQRPNIPLKDLVIAELPLRLFTGTLCEGRKMSGVCGDAAAVWLLSLLGLLRGHGMSG